MKLIKRILAKLCIVTLQSNMLNGAAPAARVVHKAVSSYISRSGLSATQQAMLGTGRTWLKQIPGQSWGALKDRVGSSAVGRTWKSDWFNRAASDWTAMALEKAGKQQAADNVRWATTHAVEKGSRLLSRFNPQVGSSTATEHMRTVLEKALPSAGKRIADVGKMATQIPHRLAKMTLNPSIKDKVISYAFGAPAAITDGYKKYFGEQPPPPTPTIPEPSTQIIQDALPKTSNSADLLGSFSSFLSDKGISLASFNDLSSSTKIALIYAFAAAAGLTIYQVAPIIYRQLRSGYQSLQDQVKSS